MKKIIIIILILVLVGIQFIRPERNLGEASGNQDITHAVMVPENVLSVFQRSCYDCHSNHTEYPWYANINPVGLWLNGHIEEGKDELNFSEFATYDVKRMDHKLEEIVEEIEEGNMPLPPYAFIHGSARLSEEEVSLITQWVKTERQKLDVPAEQPVSLR
uniref:Heme-binding domain-containing protein n=1 Tax=Roseihalotalea indica TaxID=2867963 RepID=A0AA49GSF2_9BACT|nr:heme-binding domain-containing protein [Tunicatimonas sp. TK19036]